MNKTRLIVISLVIVAAVGLRLLLTDFPNIAPITAMAIFAGMFFEKKYYAFIIPAVVMLISDLFIGFHSTMWAVYGAFALSALVGIYVKNKVSVFSMITASIVSSMLFFVLTNFAVWATGMWYPTDISGLIQCYTMAIPFFGKTIISDLFFTGAFVGGFLYAQSKLPALAEIKA